MGQGVDFRFQIGVCDFGMRNEDCEIINSNCALCAMLHALCSMLVLSYCQPVDIIIM